jgi:phytoene dehydrogenase-like protein
MGTGRSCVVVGSGPNGLSAAIALARAGCRVTVLEAEDTIGGGTRSAELTLPGFVHDICSAIHPLGVASPFFRSLPLGDFGLQWIHSPAPVAHPLDDGTAVILHRSIEETAAGLGADGPAYRDLLAPLLADGDALLDATLAPLFPPRHPIALARFGWHGMRSARGLAEARFRGERARALLAGLAAHSVLPLEAPFSASFALMLGMLGHRSGWPFPRGGSGAIARALAGYLASLGGEIVTSRRVTDPSDLPPASAVLFDVTPRQLLRITGDRLPAHYRRQLGRYRYGPAAYKLDWALDGPIPWRAPDCALAATVHLGGTLDEIAASERAATQGDHSDRPFVLLAQPSLFDPTRAPAGKHTAWAYCHVPNGSTTDMTERIERQVERFAPGFRGRILARHVMPPAELERHNANYIGGDIVGGSNDMWQLLARPVPRLNPYATPVKGWYLCSASTPPGGGVHGMAGFHAARAALRAGR